MDLLKKSWENSAKKKAREHICQVSSRRISEVQQWHTYRRRVTLKHKIYFEENEYLWEKYKTRGELSMWQQTGLSFVWTLSAIPNWYTLPKADPTRNNCGLKFPLWLSKYDAYLWCISVQLNCKKLPILKTAGVVPVCNIMGKILNSIAGLFLINSQKQNKSNVNTCIHVQLNCKTKISYLENCRCFQTNGELYIQHFVFKKY